MIGARTPSTAMAIASLLAACADTTGTTGTGTTEDPDPCGGAPTCVVISVDSPVIHTIDQLALDLVYNGIHGTAVTGVAGDVKSLPLTTAVILDVPGDPLIDVHLLAAGKLGGSVLGADARSITIQPGNHASIFLRLMPVDRCTEGAVYCGGIDDVFVDVDSLYRCTGGFIQFYASCMHGCIPQDGRDAVCFGGGLCRDGGTYCGGNVVDGDPSTLYACHGFFGSVLMQCPGGCQVHGDGNDTCK